MNTIKEQETTFTMVTPSDVGYRNIYYCQGRYFRVKGVAYRDENEDVKMSTLPDVIEAYVKFQDSDSDDAADGNYQDLIYVIQEHYGDEVSFNIVDDCDVEQV